MIRHGNQLGLTDAEKQSFRRETGCTEVPTTVQAYNRELRRTAELWEVGGSAEGKLLAAFTRNNQIDETSEMLRLVIDVWFDSQPELQAICRKDAK